MAQRGRRARRQVDAAVLLSRTRDRPDARQVDAARREHARHPVQRRRPHRRRRGDDASVLAGGDDAVRGAILRELAIELEDVLEDDPPDGVGDLDDRRGQALGAGVESEIGGHYFCVRRGHQSRLGGMKRPLLVALVLACTLFAAANQAKAPGGARIEVSPTPQAPAAAQPASPIPSTQLRTQWAANVVADHPLPEYPRPQLARKQWTNLNGTWSYAITAADAPQPSSFPSKILVPFAIESQLSGAGVWVQPEQTLWYRRTFPTPTRAAGERVLLNFGAVDWEAVVYVNGTSAGVHRGGYDPFTLDITDRLKAGPEQELVVAVRDPTDAGQQPRGKQVRRP